MLSATIAYLHYLSFMLLFAALAVELSLLNPSLHPAAAKRIVLADLIYGLSAGALLITGLIRFAYLEKGMRFYLVNPLFYAKVGVFLAVGLLSIFPTIEFLGWRAVIRRGQAIELDPQKFSRLQQVIRLELILAALIPLLAALMARGIGTGLV